MDQVARFVLTHRRSLAAVLVALAVWSGLSALTNAPDTVLVPVAARDLPGGAALTARDVTHRHVPRESEPAGLLDDDQIHGRAVAGAMRRGEMFTDRRVVDPRNLGQGRVLAVAEVPSATGEILRPGDRVDLVAVGDDGETAAVATDVEVVTIRSASDRDAAVLAVAATPTAAAEVARVSVMSRITAVLSTR